MKILPMTAEYAVRVKDMMRTFYASDAVSTNGSDDIFRADVEACISENPYAEGYVFDVNGQIAGYAMLAKSFSTEFGKPCVWLEDLYFALEHRGKGYAGEFFEYIFAKYPQSVFRLELQPDNLSARKAYEKAGFDAMHYVEMIKIG